MTRSGTLISWYILFCTCNNMGFKFPKYVFSSAKSRLSLRHLTRLTRRHSFWRVKQVKPRRIRRFMCCYWPPLFRELPMLFHRGNSATPSGLVWERRGLPEINYSFNFNSIKNYVASFKYIWFFKFFYYTLQSLKCEHGCHLNGSNTQRSPEPTWEQPSFLCVSSSCVSDMLLGLWADSEQSSRVAEVVVSGRATLYL